MVIRKYPLFSACGLNCGLCPRYYTDGPTRCPGCAGERFSAVHPSCSVLSCCNRKGIEFCFLCEDYPCRKYNGAHEYDSFITHKNQFRDLEKAREIGIEAYKIELDEKVKVLEELLKSYNDGRQKSFFCLVINLLELKDIKAVVEQIASETEPDTPLKTKTSVAVRLFEKMAEKNGVSLKLRKKTKA